MAQDDPRLPGKPEALPGVGSSDRVRQSKVHDSSIFCLTLSEDGATTGDVTALGM